jgi:replicative DNA helicase
MYQGATNIAAYAEIIRERAMMRGLIAAGHAIADSGYHSEGRTGDELLATAHASLLAVQGAEAQKGPAHINEALRRTTTALEERADRGGEMIGLSSGFRDLDDILGGFKPGEMILVAGRPSMGKSTLAQNFIEHSVLAGKHVLFFSVEMPEEMVTLRHLSSVGRVPLDALIQADIGEHGDSVLAAGGKLKNRFYQIDDSPGLLSTQILLRAQQVQAKTKRAIDLIVVDYIQKMRDQGDNQNVRVQEISGNVKHAARTLNCAVIALSQLSRECEKRIDKRPMLSDLRDSGALEQDADVIMFVYRDEVYNVNSNFKNTAEILVRKNRNGKTGNVLLTSNLHISRFDNFSGQRPVEGAKSYGLE